MSTDFSLEDVLNFMEQEEISSEFTDDAPKHVQIEKEEVQEVKPKSVDPTELGNDDEEDSEDSDDKDQEEEEPKEEESDSDEDDSGEIPKAYFEFLQKNNVLALPEDFEFDGTPEGLQTALETTKQTYAMQALFTLWDKLSPDFQAALKYNLDGGKDFAAFANTFGKQLNYDSLDLKDVSQQKSVVKDYYKKTSKYTDDKIERLIARLQETDDLADEAEEALEFLKTSAQEEKTKLLEQQEKEREEQIKKVEEWRGQITGLITDSEIPKTRKTKVQAFLLNPIKRGDSVTTDFERTLTSIFSNPKHYIQLADMLYDYDPKTGLSTTRFVEKTKTQATSKFQKELEEAMKSSGKVSGSSIPKPTGKMTLDWESILEQLDK